MDQLAHRSEQQIQKLNPNDVMGALKGIVPRSFEKTFNGLDSKQIEYAFSLCLDGLTREQVAVGMSTVRDNGFCPDPAMFRKWCLGINGFTTGVDPIHASYRSKNAALANIEAWLIDDTIKITNAERESYNRCYSMFNDLKWNYSDKQKFHTYLAFKDFYDEVVKEFVAKGEPQSIWVEPPKIETRKWRAVPKNYLNLYSDDQKEKSEKIALRIAELVESGMSTADASRQVMKESIKRSV